MKKLLLATALIAFSGPVFAGGLQEPEVEPQPEIISVEPATVASHTKSGGHGWLVPALAALMIGAAAAK